MPRSKPEPAPDPAPAPRHVSHVLNRLAAAKIPHLEPGRYHDGGGLWLHLDRGRGSWVFRYRSRVNGKLRDRGLGTLRDVSLAEARRLAAQCRAALRQGIDPVDHHRERVQALRSAISKAVTFGQCAEQYIEARRSTWRSSKHADQWSATLKAYGAPIYRLPVAAVDVGQVMRCLEPDWTTKHETMTRVAQRIAAVLDWSIARKYRSGPNPADRRTVAALLPKISKRKTVVHRAALPYREIGQFMGELRKVEGMGARCLEWQILTWCRPGEAAGALWSEIDLATKVWTIPATRTKTATEHRVPLSAPALAMLASLPRISDAVFPGVRGKPITTASSLKALHSIRPDVTAHGFRSTARDWAGDATRFPRELAEQALGHALPTVEGSYRRGDALRRRAALMQTWADFCGQSKPAGGSVVPFKAATL